jgi:hypothetical protein
LQNAGDLRLEKPGKIELNWRIQHIFTKDNNTNKCNNNKAKARPANAGKNCNDLNLHSNIYILLKMYMVVQMGYNPSFCQKAAGIFDNRYQSTIQKTAQQSALPQVINRPSDKWTRFSNNI